MNTLTFDIEDYYQVENFKTVVPFASWDTFESRVHIGTDLILSLLEKYSVTGIFFILGWIAERNPSLVKKIAAGGHEIATHGYAHTMITQQTPEAFRDDVAHSIQILQEITGSKVESYRAPCFSVTKDTLWALDILAELGIKNDYSIFPIHHDRYGIPDAERFPHVIALEGGKNISEYPMSTYEILGKRIPFSGGGYFRLLPIQWIAYMAKKMNSEGKPVIFYLHPWECDPSQPRIASPLLSKFRHYLNLEKTTEKLEHLLATNPEMFDKDM